MKCHMLAGAVSGFFLINSALALDVRSPSEERVVGDMWREIYQEVNVENKWNLYSRSYVFYGIPNPGEAIVKHDTKSRILRVKSYAKALCDSYPEIFGTLKYSQGELDCVALALKRDDKAYIPPGSIELSATDASRVISAVLGQKIESYEEYDRFRKKRALMIDQLINKLHLHDNFGKKWEIFISSFPSLTCEKFAEEAKAVESIKAEVVASEILAKTLLREFPAFYENSNYSLSEIMSLSIVLEYQDNRVGGFLGDIGNLPRAETIKSILFIITKKKFNSHDEVRDYVKKAKSLTQLKTSEGSTASKPS